MLVVANFAASESAAPAGDLGDPPACCLKTTGQIKCGALHF